ncbi:hypothetical protein H310_04884 [Aphanomyces invadans]|uniref:Choline transporter-like protein n=1 Tax=Aphanomyces invadans TaxID=157072 RepID=A0A024UC36_9STRA|nr:hypothetical protein H310_04884 [Aphanomyces invadans]ETW03417.1 hypothetical protein H310_04884 [Aphanomyces invadans]|eukprot:XP_008867646.1 hypothetical protein H310_04884 [Aphanomyces invadans]
MFTRAQRTSSNSMPSWMNSPTGETPPPSARGRKGGGRAHTSSFGDPSQPSWLNESTPRAATTTWTGSGEGDPLLPNKDTYVDIGLTRRQFKGPLGKRYSTDMLCFLLFVVYMVGMVALGIVAFVQDGLTEKAIYLTEGVDFRGRGCGPSGAVFFPHYQTNPDFGVCVTSCPIQGINVDVTLPVLSSAAWVNVSDVIASPVPPAVANATTSMSTTFQSVSFPGYDTIKQGYVCAPKEALDAVSADTSQLNDVLGLYIGGIRQNWEPLLYSAGICLGFAIVYLILLRFGGCFILGLSVVSIQVALVVAAAYVWSLSTNDGLDRHAQNILLIVAVFLVCGAMAYFLAVVVLVQRLLLAGKFLVYGTRVFSNMNKMALIPFAYAFALVAVLAWGLSVAVCLFTAGTAVDVEEAIPVESGGTVTVLVRSFQRNTTLRWLFVYHAFGMYWVVSVLLALVDMTVAMAVGVWYFTPTDRQTKAKAFDVADPVQFSMTTIVKYHVGTAAFSALVVAPVRGRYDWQLVWPALFDPVLLLHLVLQSVHRVYLQGVVLYHGDRRHELLQRRKSRAWTHYVAHSAHWGHQPHRKRQCVAWQNSDLQRHHGSCMDVDGQQDVAVVDSGANGGRGAGFVRDSPHVYDAVRDVDQCVALELCPGRKHERRTEPRRVCPSGFHQGGQRQPAAKMANCFVIVMAILHWTERSVHVHTCVNIHISCFNLFGLGNKRMVKMKSLPDRRPLMDGTVLCSLINHVE